MKCRLNGANARILAKAIQSFSKFGTDLLIVANEEVFVLRSFNSSHTAVMIIKFNKSFFAVYQVEAVTENCCRASIKSFLAIFRNMRKVEHYEMEIKPNSAKIHVILKCRLETIKNFLISATIEGDIPEVAPSDDISNTLCGSHKLFGEISHNFNATEEEVTFEVKENCLKVKNYVKGAKVNNKFMRSEFKLVSKEFDTYQVEEPAALTFCLKEFRAFLFYADSLNENIVFNYDVSGKPILFKLNNKDQLDCVLIMSTLSPEDCSFYNSMLCESNTVANKRRLIALNNDIDSTLNATMRSTDRTVSDIIVNNMDNNDNNNDNAEPLVWASNTSSLELQDARCEVNSNGTNDKVIDDNVQNRKLFRYIFSRCFDETYNFREPTVNSPLYVPNSDTDESH